MEIIKKGIVFSNDIERILKGSNALNYNYINNGISIPNKEFINNLRNNFRTTINTIFKDNYYIISEEEMITSIYSSLNDIFGVLPHCISR